MVLDGRTFIIFDLNTNLNRRLEILLTWTLVEEVFVLVDLHARLRACPREGRRTGCEVFGALVSSEGSRGCVLGGGNTTGGTGLFEGRGPDPGVHRLRPKGVTGRGSQAEFRTTSCSKGLRWRSPWVRRGAWQVGTVRGSHGTSRYRVGQRGTPVGRVSWKRPTEEDPENPGLVQSPRTPRRWVLKQGTGSSIRRSSLVSVPGTPGQTHLPRGGRTEKVVCTVVPIQVGCGSGTLVSLSEEQIVWVESLFPTTCLNLFPLQKGIFSNPKYTFFF